jgi:PleD family two-component response regulator
MMLRVGGDRLSLVVSSARLDRADQALYRAKDSGRNRWST